MAEVSVLALGNWGTALANHLATKGHSVLGWTRNKEIADGINALRKNPRYLRAVELDPKLRATTRLDDALSKEVIVMAFPSSGLAEMLGQFLLQPGTVLVSAIKGLEAGTFLTPLQYAEIHLQEKPQLAVLSGPTFAIDIINKKPAGLVVAAKDEEIAVRVAGLFASDRLRAYTSTDVIGVELGGIVKNAIALAAGVADGVGLGDSARAGLITRGLAEMMRLADKLGANVQTLSGLSGLGDLVMTATCDASRNRTVGLRLGRGEKLEAILASLGSVAEGVRTAPLILEMARQHGVEMPITYQLTRLLRGEATTNEVLEALIGRPIKSEFS